MKTAISLPDALLAQVEKLARVQHLSRTALFRRALEEYIASHTDVTGQINAALDEIGTDRENESWVGAIMGHAARRAPRASAR